MLQNYLLKRLMICDLFEKCVFMLT